MTNDVSEARILPEHLSFTSGDHVSFPHFLGDGSDSAKVWIDATVKEIHADIPACDQHPRIIVATVEGDNGVVYRAVNIAQIK